MAFDPLVEAVKCTGDPTVAPSPGEVIATCIPDAGVEGEPEPVPDPVVVPDPPVAEPVLPEPVVVPESPVPEPVLPAPVVVPDPPLPEPVVPDPVVPDPVLVPPEVSLPVLEPVVPDVPDPEVPLPPVGVPPPRLGEFKVAKESLKLFDPQPANASKTNPEITTAPSRYRICILTVRLGRELAKARNYGCINSG